MPSCLQGERVSIIAFPVRQWIIHVVSPLILGGMIYIVYRPTTLMMFGWIDFVGMSDLVAEIRIVAPHFSNNFFSDLVIFSLPHGIWVYSLTWSYLLIWGSKKSIEVTVWVFSGIITGVGGEIGQLVGFIGGTYDATDVIVCVLCGIIPIILKIKEE